MTWAERQQAEVSPVDLVLLERARDTHPRVDWWWGRNRLVTPPALWCWVCDTPISDASPAYHLPRRARMHINRHREVHVRRLQRQADHVVGGNPS